MASDTTTEEILQGCSPEIRQLAEALRKLVREVAPEAEERGIKGWKVISYSRDGVVCGIQPQRNWVNLIFYCGVELPDPEGVLDGAGKGIRAVRVKKPDDIRGDTLTPLVKEAFRQVAQRPEASPQFPGRPMPYQYIIYEVIEDHIGLITLNRPRALNALVPQMRVEWADALEQARADDHVRVLVITGAGKAFGTGIDIRDVATRRQAMVEAGQSATVYDEHSETTEHLFRTIVRFDKPYIAAVNGPVHGMDWVSLCDIRIASERASFAARYVRMGSVPAIAGCWTLPHTIGYGAAAELIWTGRFMDAAEALRLGYVSRVVPHEQLMPATLDLARRIAQGAPLAIKKAKELMRRCWQMTPEEAFDLTVQTQAWLHSTEDAREGKLAWREKREPKFQGR